jgi:hypothetical protein
MKSLLPCSKRDTSFPMQCCSPPWIVIRRNNPRPRISAPACAGSQIPGPDCVCTWCGRGVARQRDRTRCASPLCAVRSSAYRSCTVCCVSDLVGLPTVVLLVGMFPMPKFTWKVVPLSRSLCESIHRSRHIRASRLKNRMPLYKRTNRLATVCREWKRFATFTTRTRPYSFEPRSQLFGLHLARSQAGTTSARGYYQSRRLLLPYASRRNAPTRAG